MMESCKNRKCKEETLYFEEIFEDSQVEEKEWNYKTLASSSQKVGGGATLTRVNDKENNVRYYVYGGCDRNGVISNSMKRYDPVSNVWEENLHCKGTSPSPRFAHTSVSHGTRIYIYGGQSIPLPQANTTETDGTIELESQRDLFCFDTESLTWTEIKYESDIVPPCRNSHTSVILDEHMIIYGGANSIDGPLDDLWEFNISTKAWKKIDCIGSRFPGAREMHAACIACNSGGNEKSFLMYIIGGRTLDENICQDVWVLNSDGWYWEEISNMNSPLCAHTAVIDTPNNILFVFGGWDGNLTIFDDMLGFDLSTKKWINLHLKSKPVRRFSHCCVLTDRGGLMILGGVNEHDDLGDLFLLSHDIRVEESSR